MKVQQSMSAAGAVLASAPYEPALTDTVHFLGSIWHQLENPSTTIPPESRELAGTLMEFGTTSKAAAGKWSAKYRITATGPPPVKYPNEHLAPG